MKILQKKQRSWFFFCLVSLNFCFTPYTHTSQSRSAHKIYRVKTGTRTTYTQYHPKKPAQTVVVHQHTSARGALSYSGVQKKGSHPATVRIEPDEARMLFFAFEKECAAMYELRPRANS
jgi:hypothetical protein